MKAGDVYEIIDSAESAITKGAGQKHHLFTLCRSGKHYSMYVNRNVGCQITITAKPSEHSQQKQRSLQQFINNYTSKSSVCLTVNSHFTE